MSLQPVLTPLAELDAQLAYEGFAVLEPAALAELAAVPPDAFEGWGRYWDQLPPDAHLRDGGRYRRRRHGCFIVEGRRVSQEAPRAHWQPVEYNALHGGIERWFEPLEAAMVREPAWKPLLAGLAARAGALRRHPPGAPWFVEAHPFRIDTTDGIGRPTPEGAHRDGVDLVAVILVARVGVKGGETRVFQAAGMQGVRFTLSEPWSALLLDDESVIHETTPIQPLDPGQEGHRDTLVLTFRRGGFQGPAAGT